jgi:hypothetical protein
MGDLEAISLIFGGVHPRRLGLILSNDFIANGDTSYDLTR